MPKLIESIYGVKAPATPRNDLVEIFLTGLTTKADGPIKVDLNSQLNNADADPKKFQPSEQLRLNLSVPVTKAPNRLGVLGGDNQGFPNGRRLTDDVVDIEVQALEGAVLTGKIVDALAAGDKVDANDNAFSGVFPYVAPPNSAGVNVRGSAAGARSPGASGPPTSGALANRSALVDSSMSTPWAVTTGALSTLVMAGLVLLFLVGWRRRTSPRSGAGTG